MSDQKVVNINGDPGPGEPQPDVIESLEWLLTEARSGRLVGFAYATVAVDGMIATNWKGSVSTVMTMGALAVLQHELVAAYVQKCPAH